MVGRPAPGGRSQGARADQAGNADAGDDHAAELLQALQSARRHDRHRQTEAEEFTKIYKLEVVTIPTNRPVIREDQRRPRLSHRARRSGKRSSRRSRKSRDAGRPVLVGTTSVEKSEMLSADAQAQVRHRARSAQRQAARARGADRRQGGAAAQERSTAKRSAT